MDKWERDGVFANVQKEDEGTDEAAPWQGDGVRRKEAERKEEEMQEGALANSGTRKEETKEGRRGESTRKMQEAAEKMESARQMEGEARRIEEEARKVEGEAKKIEEEARKIEEEERKHEETRKTEERERELEKAKKMGATKKDAKKKEVEARKDEEAAEGEKRLVDGRKKMERGSEKRREEKLELQKRREGNDKTVKKAHFAEPESSTIMMKNLWRRIVLSDEEAVEGDEEVAERIITGRQKAETKRKASEVFDSSDESPGNGINVKRRKRPGRDKVVAEEKMEKGKGKGRKPTSKKSITIALPHPCAHCSVRAIPCTMTNTSDNRRSCDNCHASKKKCGIIKNKIFLTEKAKEHSVFGLVAARMLKAVDENEGGEIEDEMDVPDEGETGEFSSELKSYRYHQYLPNIL